MKMAKDIKEVAKIQDVLILCNIRPNDLGKQY